MSSTVQYLASNVYVRSPSPTGIAGARIDNNFKTLVDADVAHAAATVTHGATGAVVGTTNAQTLTNKSISGSANTLTNIPQSAVTNLSTDFEAVANKNQPNGYAGLDSDGDLVGTIVVRSDTAAGLAAVVLVSGQPGYATDTKKFAIGDGSTAFAALMPVGGSELLTATTVATLDGASHSCVPSAANEVTYIMTGNGNFEFSNLFGKIGQRITLMAVGITAPVIFSASPSVGAAMYYRDASGAIAQIQEESSSVSDSNYGQGWVILSFVVMAANAGFITATSLSDTDLVAWNSNSG